MLSILHAMAIGRFSNFLFRACFNSTCNRSTSSWGGGNWRSICCLISVHTSLQRAFVRIRPYPQSGLTQPAKIALIGPRFKDPTGSNLFVEIILSWWSLLDSRFFSRLQINWTYFALLTPCSFARAGMFWAKMTKIAWFWKFKVPFVFISWPMNR